MSGAGNRLHIDIETYSSVDIGKAGLYKYVQSPDFQILLFAYSLNDAPVEIIDLASGETIPDFLFDLLQNPNTYKYAYNAVFEWACINKFFSQYVPFFDSPISQWRCSMVRAMYYGYPAGLDAVTRALGLPADKQKIAAGKALIRLFCTKHEHDRLATLWNMDRVLPEHEPEKWQLFKDYCKQDVVAELAVHHAFFGSLPEREQKLWELDAEINARGVRIDEELVGGALACWANVSNALLREAKSLTGLSNPNSPTQIRGWLEAMIGRELPDMTKASVSDLLSEDLPDDVRRVLEIRQELGKTSVKKYEAMRAAICGDGRARGLLQFYGSRTGRWAGRLIQVQNLPRNYIESLDAARQLTKLLRTDALRVIYGNVPDTLSQLIRTAFIASPGNVLVVADFSAIEARVISWLAGEEWRLKAFRAGKDIYCESASQMFGVPVEKHGRNAHLRQKGKIAELALGYQGGVGALKAMGADKMGLSDDELQDIVSRWREANPAIVRLWSNVEEAAHLTCKDKISSTVGAGRGYPRLWLQSYAGPNEIPLLSILLPSERQLFYPAAQIGVNKKGREAILYEGLENTTHKWGMLETYGGKLVENIVQAIARDCLAETLLRLKAAGFDTVMHIHDEVVLDVPEARADLDEVVRIMCEPISWAPGLPLAADGFVSSYYKKE